ncbi:cell elongation-specific peptidoglycan biosynthesis regulator RodA [Desulfonispora thiosulfatigenes DSM 11270]|uniref:Cell elongation-specific peptidoglycan biosynthesis regulator RodA n=1 Tax=Desulfonispora thiosulfatigenes DSM 11270 TaxID=656914 RepID=A0A1W1VJC5_DESTI|nr:FtsW/RodA/SpoVE family cell cycle protein [Desulfonispora thiosulfatigenes]SMB93428.1 cell elongation-specific peptidoglycan biosynthesis regulator RodA [Desulfonispora thiosulfatigenes DSM 11270]
MNNFLQDFKLFFLNIIVILLSNINLIIQETEIPNLIFYNIILIVSLFLVKLFIIKVLQVKNLIFDIISLLISLGWIFLIRLNPYLAPRQLLWICIGLIVMLVIFFIVKNIPMDFIKNNKYLWLIITLTLLILPLLKGVEVGGATSWLQLGKIRFQSSELAKIFYLVFLTSLIRESTFIKGKGFFLAWIGTLSSVAILVLQKDLGMALVFYLTFLLIIYLTTKKITSQVWGIIILLLAAIVAYYYFPHVRFRILTWLSPWENPHTSGYQIIFSLFSFSNGGILGVGLGNGFSKFIPEVHTDFMFAAIGEQLGLLGSISIILLYLLFLFFCYHEIKFIPTKGRRILALGLSAIMVIESFVIMAGVSKLIPLTGLPLPFMGYGGSAVITNFINLGFILALTSNKSITVQMEEEGLNYIFKIIWIVALALILNLTYWQVIKSNSMKQHPLNPRYRIIKTVHSTNIPTSLHKVIERNEV